MGPNAFAEYIKENCDLDAPGTAERLVRAMLLYANGFQDDVEAQSFLRAVLCQGIQLDSSEAEKFRIGPG